MNLHPCLITQGMLCLYVAHLYQEGLLHTSIKSYFISAVRNMQISNRLPDPFASPLAQLDMVIRGVKVCRGLQGCNIPWRKFPITPSILPQLKSLWKPHATEYKFTMLCVAPVSSTFPFGGNHHINILLPHQFFASSKAYGNPMPQNTNSSCCVLQLFLRLFRLGEIATSTSYYDPSIHLSIQDIALDSHHHPSLVQFDL